VTGALRIGTLGAARITPTALIKPAREVPAAEIVAVAARDRQRAEAFAKRHDIPRVHAGYDDLIADPEVDAIYNPLPNSLHAPWTLAAIAAGKHVLCEKPFTANAKEADQVAAAARGSGLVVMEAFHYRYHPLADRMREVVESGELGTIRHIETEMCVPIVKKGDIRYRLDLAGGATMDVGTYAIHLMRFLAGDEPEVVRAEARLSSPGVDRWMQADYRFSDGRTGRTTCSMFSAALLKIGARVVGDAGEMHVLNPIGAHYYHRLTIHTRDGRTRERVGTGSTYLHQLRAFCAAVLHDAPVLTPPEDAVANMRVIDAVYRAAGMSPRGEGGSNPIRL
jgi:predicted dehydrogenase